MKIQYWKDPSLEEDHIDVHYRQETETIDVIREFFSSFNSIMGKKEDGMHKIHPGSIYYLEVVDRKLFAYQEKEVYQLDYSLRNYLELFGTNGFVQIGKSMAVNIYKVNRLKADLNMRLRLQMDNGEVLILNRNYKKAFLEMLKHIKEVCYENN
ncbi:MAG: LytTR family DNA-binding domain-containing protein [Bacillota bacterium]|nr:LytTR family DNA-binding domain-containing protein [Bacillota bacterium]